MPAGPDAGTAPPRAPARRARAAALLRRAGRRTNAGLLLLLVGSLATGGLAFATAGPVSARAAAVAHGVVGLGLVVLAPWKVVVARRAPRLTATSLTLAGLVVVCLVAGVVEVLAGPDLTAPLTPIQVHVGAAVGIVVLLVVHVTRHWRPRLVRRTDAGRRQLLRTATFGAAAAGAYVVVEGVATATGVARERTATGSHPIAASAIPATIWLLDRVPGPSDRAQRVLVDGVGVDAAELDARGTPVRARLDCTTGWYADATWTGVALADLLPAAAVAQARSVVVTSVTGYRRRFNVQALAELHLCTRVEGERLSPGTGAPVRLVAPGHRGFWWVKWVASVELSPLPAAAQSPFPLQ
ncbi:molybdopterin-dependent oxidoreductase [Microlunatus flavus]|uniref:Oxidoreductase molybdopterin binding domain-containing protein n=1 Tax=Microlunatus flavus TaxID=1036181 RepID=A0A1H9J9W5_9ACTN|nr:molybdopterin-dependent oxidoreductase [Microlunatus flavus]SEQ83519.1 Oxidoreductase molybdopterin binding domain-containing protein [Microlunatus flavus]